MFVSGDAGSRQFAIVLKTAGSQAVTAGDLIAGTMAASAVIGVSAATASSRTACSTFRANQMSSTFRR